MWQRQLGRLVLLASWIGAISNQRAEDLGTHSECEIPDDLLGRWEVTSVFGYIITYAFHPNCYVTLSYSDGTGIARLQAATGSDVADGWMYTLQGHYRPEVRELLKLEGAKLELLHWTGARWAGASGARLLSSSCDLGERVSAFSDVEDCEPELRECWQNGTVVDGPERGDAFLTILWDEQVWDEPHGRFMAFHRTHASLVRRLQTGKRCLPAFAVSSQLATVSQRGHQYIDRAFDNFGKVLRSSNRTGVTCKQMAWDRDIYVHMCFHRGWAEERREGDKHLCHGTCHRLAAEHAVRRCYSPARTLPLLQKYANWRWYSQGAQDAVNHFMLLRKDGVPLAPQDRRFFVEFGSMGISDSNTEYLRRLGWRGVLFDLNNHDPSLGVFNQRITPANVIEVFQKHGVPKEPDLVSIDIDSCDVQVFLELTRATSPYRPRVVQIEYNRHFGTEKSIALDCSTGAPPEGYDRGAWGIYGASILAIERAAKVRGYTVVWVLKLLDVFLVRDDLICPGEGLPLGLNHFPNYSAPATHWFAHWGVDEDLEKIDEVRHQWDFDFQPQRG